MTSSLNRNLAIVCLLLILALAVEVVLLQAGNTLNAAQGVETRPISPLSLPEVSDLAAESVQKILQSPVFYPDRKPINASGAAAGNATQIGNWQLTGVVRSDDQTRVMFQEINGSLLMTLSEGMNLDRWKIEKVLTDRVIFEYEGETLEMELPVVSENTVKQQKSSRPLRKTNREKRL